MQNLSSLKRIILFLNASSYRLALAGTSGNSVFDNYRSIAIGFNCCIEYFLFKISSINTTALPSMYFTMLLVSPIIIHSCIDFIFSAELKLINENYSAYYGKYYYLIYCILAISGVIYAVYFIFNR